MSAVAPWSVKGINPKAREIAKELARREGMTLGEWLNERIMVESSDDGDDASPNADERLALRRSGDRTLPREATERLNTILRELGERLETAERRSAHAIEGVEQAVSGIMRRMDGEREEGSRQTRRIDDISRELREGHLRLQRLESTMADPRRADAATNDLRERLDRAQEATGLALKGLERSFAALDSRIGGATAVDETRLEKLAEGLGRQIEENRQDLMRRIEATADGSRLARVEQAIAQLTAQTRAAEMRSARAVEAMGQEVMRIARNMHGRMQVLEAAKPALDEEALQGRLDARLDERLLVLGRTLDEKLDREISRHAVVMDARLNRQEDQHAIALERLSDEITRISDRLSERIAQTERRSSQAIDDIGRRLSESSEKIERRQEEASGELADRMRQSEERTRRLLEEAREARAQREAAAANSAPRLSAPLAVEDDLAFAPMPQAAATDAGATSLFGSASAAWSAPDAASTDWRGGAFASVPAVAPEAQAVDGWADAVAAEMAIDPFPTADTQAPFGALDAGVEPQELEATDPAEDLLVPTDDALAQGDGSPDAIAAAVRDEFPSIFVSDDTSENAEEPQEAFATAPLSDEALDFTADNTTGMTFDAAVEDDAAFGDVFSAPLTAQDAVEAARAAIEDEEILPIRKTFGLKKQRKGGKSVLQERLDRKASRDGSTLGNALKASALAMLVVGGGGYATLKLAKDQNLSLNFGVEPLPGTTDAPMAALALDGAPTEAVPSKEVAATEGAAIFARAVTLLDAGDSSGVEPLTRAAEMGYVPAQMRLAHLLTEGGPGVEVNLAEAREWTRRAAEGGEPRAMQHYATQLYEGTGGPLDEAGALDWMRKAAEAGRVDAQFNLAHLYENGVRGMSPDKVEAFTWYMIAARRGDQQALQAVQRLTPTLNAGQRQRARDGADAFNVQPSA